tara:strand:- start:670 stop:2196 length:1527 start_codon:yes stop_codon:yes gene_type:complete
MNNLNKHKHIFLLILILLGFGTTQAQMTWAFGEYTGNGIASALTGVGFQPGAVFIKSEGATEAVIATDDMTAGDTKPMGSSNTAHETGRITSLDSDGFTLGTDADVNSDGVVYQWIAFYEENDISIGTYAGTGASVDVNTLGFQPEMIWLWGDGTQSEENAVLYMSTNVGEADRFSDGTLSSGNMLNSLDASGFNTSSNSNWGPTRSGINYYYIGFNSGSDMELGGWTNGSDVDNTDKVLSGGWQPDLVITNAGISGLRPIFKTGTMTGDESLRFNATTVYANAIQAINVDGFQIGTQDLAQDEHNAMDYMAMKGGTEQTVSLPIELIKFDASLQDDQVVITWTTGSELNNDFFQVERSINGIDFEIIEVVSGAGNSQDVINYISYDVSPPSGIIYYRIRQIDFDGQNEVFDVKSVYNGTSDRSDWIHATESGNHKLNIFGDLEGTYDVVIIDVNGKVVFNKSFLTTSQNKTSMLITLPPDLKNAVYLVNIQNNGYQNSGKILIRDLK